jgi:hypothetical protein
VRRCATTIEKTGTGKQERARANTRHSARARIHGSHQFYMAWVSRYLVHSRTAHDYHRVKYVIRHHLRGDMQSSRAPNEASFNGQRLESVNRPSRLLVRDLEDAKRAG